MSAPQDGSPGAQAISAQGVTGIKYLFGTPKHNFLQTVQNLAALRTPVCLVITVHFTTEVLTAFSLVPQFFN